MVIVPEMPNPNSGKLYQLQVGAFSRQQSAEITAQYLNTLGFKGMLERNNSLNRVLAADIPAAEVYAAVQRLGAAGFKEIWIRE